MIRLVVVVALAIVWVWSYTTIANAGATWVAQDSGVNGSLIGVDALDASTAWVSDSSSLVGRHG